ncbi:MAG TPA: flagellar cap protein FliD N-terminal domain-containing protein, partial [Longilinea sp.]|nr:flagellar cap protein FliD N-terminal domain-containing protein [Longilinea sp.]
MVAPTTSSNGISDIDAQILKLAPTFQTAIKTEIDAQSAPLNKVKAESDAIDVTKAVYTDMKTNFDALQDAVQALISTQDTYALGATAKSSVTSFSPGSTVFTAATQDSALAGEYDISVSTLAKAETQATAASASADIALGKSGIFWLGGNGKASVDGFTPSTSVLGATTGAVASGQRELGSTVSSKTQNESYSLQVRDYDGVRQFRLANADGTAVSIRKTDGSGYTDDWQTMTNGSYDTGRGLALTLSTAGETG